MKTLLYLWAQYQATEKGHILELEDIHTDGVNKSSYDSPQSAL